MRTLLRLLARTSWHSYGTPLLLLALLPLALLPVGCGKEEALPSPEPPTPVVLETLPLIREVRIEPSAPTLGQDLRAVPELRRSPETLALTFDWIVNGVPVAFVVGDTLPHSRLQAQDYVKVNVTATASGEEPQSMSSPNVIVQTGLAALSGSALEGRPCSADADCGRGTCALTGDGMRCINTGSAAVSEGKATEALVKSLEQETRIQLATQDELTSGGATESRYRNSQSQRSSGRSQDRAQGSTASTSRAKSKRLRLGDPCGGTGCGEGLTCKGVGSVRTCVPE